MCIITCLKNSHSGAWLSICPSAAAGLRLGNHEFNVLCRFRFGYEIFPQSVRKCPLCGAVNDVYGDHLLCCQQNGISRRHNAIVDYLPVVKAAGLSTEPLTSIVDNDSVSSHRGIDQSLVLRILDRFPPFLMGH